MVDNGRVKGVKNGRKSDDVINGRPLRGITFRTSKFEKLCFLLHIKWDFNDPLSEKDCIK